MNANRQMDNEQEKELVTRCYFCDKIVYRGEEYYSNGDVDMCLDCYDEFSHFGG